MTSGGDPPDAVSAWRAGLRGRRTSVLLRAAPAALLLVAAAGLAGLRCWRGAHPPAGPATAPRGLPGDPRLSYAGPYLNVRPGVGYVGDSACADCHVEKAQSYARHPMARSLVPAARLMPAPPEGAKAHNPFEALGSRFRVVRRNGHLRQRRTRLGPDGRPVYEVDVEADYVIGSGRRGHSYLCARDGFLFQAPVSWFSQNRRWDLSPGFAAFGTTSRPVTADCVFCHANQARPVAGTQNRYEEPVFRGYGIGCERCHGPGALHVKERTRDLAVEGPVDYTIVNPGRLAPKLREAVCQQCHLEGEARVVRRGRGPYDFRPGLPLEDFLSVFVLSPEEGGEGRRAVNHVEQMHQSRCFRASAGADRPLGCVSCHDPHVAVGPERRVAHYRAACLGCHNERGCSLPQEDRLRQSPDDSCVDCHMPRHPAEDVAHTASTDHGIPRRAEPDGPPPPHPPGGAAEPLVLFGAGRVGRPDRERLRNLGVALVRAASKGRVHPQRSAARAADLLAGALEEAPEDVEAWEARGWALSAQGRPGEALAAFEEALARQPRREGALAGAATAAEELKRAGAARGYWRQAVAVNPWLALYRRHLALLLMEAGAWDEVEAQCRAWRRLDPESAEARMLWVTCLARAGKKDEARAEFARVEALRPPNLDALRRLAERQLR